MSPHAPERRIAHCEPALHEASRAVCVLWNSGDRDAFHFVWLRDNCPCPACRHPQTLERTVDLLSWSADVRPEKVEVTLSGDLEVLWNDGHVSLYDGTWLFERRYSSSERASRRRPLEPFDATLTVPVSDYQQVMSDDTALLQWLRALHRFGLAKLTATPREHLQVLKVAERIGYPRQTNFGTHFDVVSKPHPNNNAYTSIALPAHTDLPNWANPPGLQLLHCLEQEARGGDSLFVDGARVVEALREEAPESFALLSSLPIDFRFRDAVSDIRFRAPLISLNPWGQLAVLRYNEGIRDAVDVPFEQVEPFYDALRRFASITRRPELVVKCRLEPGELVIFDNHRVLHGRAKFDPNSGKRHFQGCYVEHDELVSRLRTLERPIS